MLPVARGLPAAFVQMINEPAAGVTAKAVVLVLPWQKVAVKLTGVGAAGGIHWQDTAVAVPVCAQLGVPSLS